MFARRKWRPLDDEPLVPHGLVGQAIEQSIKNPTNLTVVAREPVATREVTPAEVRPEQQAESHATLSLIQRKREATAAPLEAVDRPNPASLQSRSESASLNPDRTRNLPLKPQIKHRPAYRVLRRSRMGAAEMYADWRKLLAVSWLRCTELLRKGATILKEVTERAEEILRSIEFRKYFLQGRDFAAASVQRIASVGREWAKKIQPALQKRRTRTAANSFSVVDESGALPTSLGSGARAKYRLRIRLSGVPLHARVWLARASAGWRFRAEFMPRDSRLWTPLAMGLVSAMVVLGLVSATRHYAKSALPTSRILPVASAATPPPVASASIAPKAPAPVKLSVSRKMPRQQRLVPRTSGSVPAAKAKRHYNEDEDYVAKDTYVYYGKRSR